MFSDISYSEIIFFLGAGASIDAGFVDVIELKNQFLKWLESESKENSLSISNEILKTLQSWKAKGIGQKNDVDIEIFLETVEKIENKDENPLSEFYENNTLKIERNHVYRSVLKQRTLSKDIKRFVKVYFNRTDIHTDYLKCLLNFLQDGGSLQIFSTNYDICIEQFCRKYGISFVDTFDPKFNTKNGHNKQDANIILYKLHGSTT